MCTTFGYQSYQVCIQTRDFHSLSSELDPTIIKPLKLDFIARYIAISVNQALNEHIRAPAFRIIETIRNVAAR